MTTFSAVTPLSGFAANRLHFVLHNGNVSGWVVRVRLVVIQPGVAAVTGAAPSEWTLRRRNGTTTAPSGTGSVAIVPSDTDALVPTGVTAWNIPQGSPAGGTLESILSVVPQADEQKATTLDAPTSASLQRFGGVSIYDATALGDRATPLTIRQNQTLELAQSVTAGTGNCRIWCVFTCEG